MSHLPASSATAGAPAPRLVALQPTQRDLPRSLTTFIGRDVEIAAVAGMLARADVRLLTLAGPGGIGKTRLALQVAETVGEFPDGVWFVPLATVTDPALVVPIIAGTVGASRNPHRTAEDQLTAHLAEARALLILDNFEQVVDAGPAVSSVLMSCPRLKVLVTSRTLLHLSGEQIYTVPPLVVPGPQAASSTGALERSEAIQLFVERARARRPDFALTAENAPVIRAICQRLDGLPLGIELAAARLSVLSPANLLDRLDARLATLAGGARDQPGRLRSLRESIAWSYDLLPAPERLIFRRLGVFAGPWTLEAAEAVMYAADEPQSLPVIDGVAALIDRNMVRHQIAPGGESQYQLLETIREFAAELLDASEDAEAVRRRLSAWLGDIAQEAFFALVQPDGAARYARLELFEADVRRAFAWLEASGEVDEYLRIAGPTAGIGRTRGWYIEGRTYLERGIALVEGNGSPWLGQAKLALAIAAHMGGDESLAWLSLQEAMTLIEAANDMPHRFLAVTMSGLIAQRRDDVYEAERYQQAALELLPLVPRQPWVPYAESTVLGHLGNNAITQGNMAKARAYFERAIEVQRSLGHEPGTGHYSASHPIAGLGDAARGERDNAAAMNRYQHALRLALGPGDFRGTVYAIGGVAASLACLGEWRQAARLFGACEALFDRTGVHFGMEIMDRQRGLGLPEPWFRSDESFGSARYIKAALWSAGPPPYPPLPDLDRAAALWEAGRALSLEETVTEALGAEPPKRRASEDSLGLTSREREVLQLVTAGKSDSEIAEALYVSRRTAATHVGHIYDKIGVSSRAAAAAWAVRNGIA